MKRLITASFVVFAMAGCGGETTEHQGLVVTTPSDIVTLMGTPRLTSLSSAGGGVIAEGQASTAPGENLRTQWFEVVGAVEYAQHFGGSYMHRKVFNGATLIDEEKDDVGTLTGEADFYSEQDLIDHANQFAEAAGVVVEEVNYVPFFGGAAEFVLRPTNEAEFLAEADLRISRFLDAVHANGRRPVLMTIVNSAGANRLVTGGAPTSDGTGPVIASSIGMTWQADDIHIWDRGTGPRIDTPEPLPCDDPAALSPPCPGG